jgi:hypothetical protein
MKNETVKTVNGKTEKRVPIIEEFYNQFKPEDLTYKEFEAICKTPFLHMRRKLATDELYEIRLKFFGKFMPSPSKIVWLLEYTQERYDKELITQKTYNKSIMYLTNYISRKVDSFKHDNVKKDYSKRVAKWIKI